MLSSTQGKNDDEKVAMKRLFKRSDEYKKFLDEHKKDETEEHNERLLRDQIQLTKKEMGALQQRYKGLISLSEAVEAKNAAIIKRKNLENEEKEKRAKAAYIPPENKNPEKREVKVIV